MRDRDEHLPRRSRVRTYRRGSAIPVSFYCYQLFHAETCGAYIHTLRSMRVVACTRIGRSVCSPYASPLCGCCGASANITCCGTWAFSNSCATFDSRMHSSRPRCSCRQRWTQSLLVEPGGEHLSNVWTILIFYKLQ